MQPTFFFDPLSHTSVSDELSEPLRRARQKASSGRIAVPAVILKLKLQNHEGVSALHFHASNN